ncbi:DNA polymerase alpha/epsilon subunit B-domain-containing protein [Emericellopsis atlantica]|uniref:DNA polymerase epsilon subunit B n=1 Tax=Emericellopsis atlantica TaxID=2614577 RepID=A0A9P7ZIB4_9HYPO|nr:DNA polymerase alpha/epsilon subunit B-domain-containing protein [Emericellopsis atlantica]KAG9252003.1 DNA polymerase alpha/epsilon subunit B-domain-containing protein [Emericellopsis atlantica]
MDKTPAPLFRNKNIPPSSNLPSSSPAFGTPAHPLKPFALNAPKTTILPIILPPATLRPLAFRTFTKKHSLTLTSSALQELAGFIGRHCGSGWREEGLAERVLEEIARSWKNRNGGVMVDGASKELHDILKTLEGNMSGGKITGPNRGLQRSDSLLSGEDDLNTRLGLRPSGPPREDSNASFGMSAQGVQEEQGDEDDEANDPRAWLQVVDAYQQPRLLFNVGKKHFERETSKPSLLPPADHKTTLFRNRYHVIHQRILRNEAFQTSSVSASRKHHVGKETVTNQQSLKITPIANLLGRHGSSHMLLGLLVTLPSGGIAISDLSGTIALDLKSAVSIPADSAWFCPGMIVLVDGVYEEEDESHGKGLSGTSGVGGVLGGKFQGFFIGQPPCEKRKATLGISDGSGSDHTIGGGFGWIDFLGVGSSRALGSKMRRLQNRLLSPSFEGRRSKIVILGELNLDNPRALQALRQILSIYNTPEPLSFVITGNFTTHAVLARGGSSGGSIEYKEYFDALASVLADFPHLLQASTFLFVPGDNDGWVSSFTAGASTPLPRKGVPEMFTSRVRRAFATANADNAAAVKGEAIWGSNPARMTVFGPEHEIVVMRDDMSSRLRRTSVHLKPPQDSGQDVPEEVQGDAMDLDVAAPSFSTPEGVDASQTNDEGVSEGSKPESKSDTHAARKMVKSILDQGYMSPFPPSIRPVHWDFASSLHIYPLPTAMVLVDTSAPTFCVTYEGCHVMNPGSVLVEGRRGVGRWIEYEVGGLGRTRECIFGINKGTVK